MQIYKNTEERARAILGWYEAKELDKKLKSMWLKQLNYSEPEFIKLPFAILHKLQPDWDNYYELHATKYLDEFEAKKERNKTAEEKRLIKQARMRLIRKIERHNAKRKVWKIRKLHTKRRKAA
jgi:hypothetical protein